MKNRLRSESSTSLGLLLARLPMGAYFLLAGIHKLTATGGVQGFVNSQLGNVPSQVPQAWGQGYLHALPYAEIVVGSMLILGLFGRLAGFAGAAVVTTIIVGYTGIFSTTTPFHANVIYLGLLLMILLVGPGRMSLDGLIFGRGKAVNS
jgi:uncharacterized membrane protein YphA (DoxX/SURF4 family)